MPIITLPATPGYQTSSFSLMTNTQRFVSPLDGTSQTRELPGAKWRGTYTLPPMPRAVAAPWLAALAKLRGGANRFKEGDPDCRTARGVATGTPLVNGAAQAGASLITDGWTAGQTGILLAGDYIEFTNGNGNAELHLVVADTNSDGAGQRDARHRAADPRGAGRQRIDRRRRAQMRDGADRRRTSGVAGRPDRAVFDFLLRDRGLYVSRDLTAAVAAASAEGVYSAVHRRRAHLFDRQPAAELDRPHAHLQHRREPERRLFGRRGRWARSRWSRKAPS